MLRVRPFLIRSIVAFTIAGFIACGAPGAVGAASAQVLWVADNEEGDLSDWYSPSHSKQGPHGGGEYNSGRGDSHVSRLHAKTGRWGVQQAINASGVGSTSGTRLFRWQEAERNGALYYSVWYFFPARITVKDGYFNAFQFKSSDGSRNDPLWVLGIANRPSGQMYFRLDQWNAPSIGQSVSTIPTGRWVHVEAYYAIATNATGAIRVWQDGKLLFDLKDIQTAYQYCCNPAGNAWNVGWSVNAYGRGFTPVRYVHYIDDAVISTSFIK